MVSLFIWLTVVNLINALQLYTCKYKQFTRKYDSRVVIYACRGFIRQVTFWAFLNNSAFYVNTPLGTFSAKFWKNWASIYSIIWSQCLCCSYLPDMGHRHRASFSFPASFWGDSTLTRSFWAGRGAACLGPCESRWPSWGCSSTRRPPPFSFSARRTLGGVASPPDSPLRFVLADSST